MEPVNLEKQIQNHNTINSLRCNKQQCVCVFFMLFLQVDAKTTALAMAITDSELSDEEASILESGGFSVSRATTPQLTDVSEGNTHKHTHTRFCQFQFLLTHIFVMELEQVKRCRSVQSVCLTVFSFSFMCKSHFLKKSAAWQIRVLSPNLS